MPGLITVPDFVRETREDFSSPTTSTFVQKIPHCRETVSKLDEALSQDREGLCKLKNCLKDIQKSGLNHVSLDMELSKVLDKMGDTAITREEEEDDIGAAFQKFAIVTKELSTLMKNLMQNLTNIILFPVENVLKNELRGSKGDLKRPFDRAWRDYHDKYAELERSKKKQAKEAGMIRSELTAGEIAEDLEKERKYLQIATADYLIKANEIKTKKGTELLQHLLDYYRAQTSYFNDGLKTIEHFGTYIAELNLKMNNIRAQQEEEKRALIDVRNSLKNSPGFNKMNGSISTSQYTLHQAKGDPNSGHRKSGYLNKRSEGRLRNVWQKRRCEVRDGFLKISHADENKPPSQVNLLTCQMKPVLEDRLCFDVVSFNRTYHFQAESDTDRDEWMSVLLNSKEKSLNRAFEDNGKTGENQGLVEFQQTLVNYIRNIPSNSLCCDCGSGNDVTWLSTNFGIIVCIECSGIHREMGVHITKIQSLTLDHIGTSQLLVSRVMGNEGFNKIMESRARSKPNPNSSMEERKAFIRAKYMDKAYIEPYTTTSRELFAELEQAIHSHNLPDLLQCMAEGTHLGVELTDPLPNSEFSETSLHHAISQETGTSLYMVDFIIQNSSSLDRRTKEGNTPLHYCVIQNQPEAMRLLLRSGASPDLQNNNGKTPLGIAKERGYHLCEELLLHAINRQKVMFENVNIDWNLGYDDGSTDFSDEETLEDHQNSHHHQPRTLTRTPDRANKSSRPMSVYTTPGPPTTPVMMVMSASGSLGGAETPTHTAAAAPLATIDADSPESTSSSSGGGGHQNRSRGSVGSDWSRSDNNSSSSSSGDSPGSAGGGGYSTGGRVGVGGSMPPPPPPQSKKPSLFSGSNLANHIVGSLKKGKSLTPIPPTTYNTLPSNHLHHTSSSHHHQNNHQLNNNTTHNNNNNNNNSSSSSSSNSHSRSHSEGMMLMVTSSQSPVLSLPTPAHKRSPSSDSGNAGSRSTTPVSYHMVSGHKLTTSPKSKLPPPLKSYHMDETNRTPTSTTTSSSAHHRLHTSSSSSSSSPANTASPAQLKLIKSSSSSNTTTPSKSSSSSSSKSKMINAQSTESLESLSDEMTSNSGGDKQSLHDPPPRRRPEFQRYKRCRALYDCEADNEDELTFEEGDVIVILAEETEDDNWMEGILESEPDRRGLFPASFVHMLTD